MKSEAQTDKKGWGWESIFVWLGAMLFSFLATGAYIYAVKLDFDTITIAETFQLAVVAAITQLTPVLMFMNARGGAVKMLGLDRFRLSYISKTLLGFAAYFALFIATIYLIAQLYPNFNIDQDQDFGFNKAATNIELILSFISLVIITPFVEEVIYRGLIFKGFNKAFSFWPAVIVSSGIFALLHGQANVAVDTFILGGVAAYLLVKTNSLWPAIILHSLKNAVAFVVIFVIGL